ncbi:uncharacterized protein EV154DRAFT_488626 [Mucor mucedo]|uniref:uncharacterized protein n=1 Tax=Mucor mucedo TaxID=29922 RepID=UPI00221EF170|nr:uncharacterized protein EV154DRAFT_488626 [Mucor mucedo]KAI7865990.1 hypothetical protein EV154DRAFT_488626 [Mucor mucedo]
MRLTDIPVFFIAAPITAPTPTIAVSSVTAPNTIIAAISQDKVRHHDEHLADEERYKKYCDIVRIPAAVTAKTLVSRLNVTGRRNTNSIMERKVVLSDVKYKHDLNLSDFVVHHAGM